MKLLLGGLCVFLRCLLTSSQPLDPDGRNVCHNVRDPSTLVCCTGWRQDGKECTIAVCEGNQACTKEELCVYPGVCRCPPGYFGAHCKTRCPPEFWGADCRQVCLCHPHGQCHLVTGECVCNNNRWGPQCQHACKCTRHGHCHPVYGNCTCDEGWWSSTCSKTCQCDPAGSVSPGCDQLTGRCLCHRGHWGLKCPVSCNCYQSSCNQRTGVCECELGWWGPNCDWRCNCDLTHGSCDPANGQCLCNPGYQGVFCNQPCEPGKYGSWCKMSCGKCEGGHPCSPTDGTCVACEAGWNGTNCDLECPYGSYGVGCRERCPKCRNNESCDPKTGECRQCDAGWTGPRCEKRCSDRTYGVACRFLCSPCFHGYCHHVTGRCVCETGFEGESCNSSCSALQFGPNCSLACNCGDGINCNPVTGVCPNSGRGALLAGILVPLLLLLLAVLCCCLCCGGAVVDTKDSMAVADGGVTVRMKYHVYSVLANIGAALPCISDWSSGLPRVTVSHHDPELTFNHSFIEPPSSGWVIEGSSFDSDEEEEEEEGEVLYCVPPREDVPTVVGNDFQEMSSKCNMLLDPSGFSNEDIASPFNIPRTSSIAKSKRPSVSFAEGTRFSPKERRGSGQDLSANSHNRKPKPAWGVLMLSSLQSQGGATKPGEDVGVEDEEKEDGVDVQMTQLQEMDQEVDKDIDGNSNPQSRNCMQNPGASGRRRTMSNPTSQKGTHVTASPSDAPAGVSNKVTTVYVTVGRAGKPVSKVESSSESPVQAMLRRLGSLQRKKEQEPSKTKPEGIAKPPRRKLGARANVWEQGGMSGGEVSICKPIRRKHTSPNTPDAEGSNVASDGGAAKRPLSSILKSVPEVALADSASGSRAVGNSEPGVQQPESSYLTVGPPGDASSLTTVIANEGAATSANDEPCYENVMITYS